MFLTFFYKLRENGIGVSLSEWMTLMEALYRGLHNNSFMGFYKLSRAVLCKNEADFDIFDGTFAEVFKDAPYKGPVPDEVMNWLLNPKERLGREFKEELEALRKSGGYKAEDFAELLRRMEDTLRRQDSEHNGGTKWVGTGGRTGYGNSGWYVNGIRIGGESTHKTAMDVAGERNFRDFRKDKIIDDRQFQVAFKKLRAFSKDDINADKVLDIDGTIRATCDKGGLLSVRYMPPRKNSIKLLLLMDSGGSMDWWQGICNTLFNAAAKCNFFKELHTYYFHNCIFDKLYNTPALHSYDSVPTEEILNTYNSEYKVIIVGDAAMNPHELNEHRYDWYTREYEELTGMDRLMSFKAHFPYLIWLNPEKMPEYHTYWTETHYLLSEIFNMYELSVDGLEQGIKALMSRK